MEYVCKTASKRPAEKYAKGVDNLVGKAKTANAPKPAQSGFKNPRLAKPLGGNAYERGKMPVKRGNSE